MKMKIYNTLEKQVSPTAVALGYFDGVHIGHQKVLKKTAKFKKEGLIPTVFTFSSNPKSEIMKIPEKKIFSMDEKQNAMQNLGIEIMYVTDFSKIKNMSAEQFVREVLFKTLNAKVVICGFNYHFGAGGIADATDLKRICLDYGITTKIVNPVLFNKSPVSSTRIRKALLEGNTFELQYMLRK